MDNRVRTFIVRAGELLSQYVLYWPVYLVCVVYQTIKHTIEEASGDAETNTTFWRNGMSVWGQ